MWAQQEKKKRNERLIHKMSLVEFKNVLLVEEFDTMEYLPRESINKKTLKGRVDLLS